MKNIPYYGPVTLPAADRQRLHTDFDESLIGAESAIPLVVTGWGDPQHEANTDRGSDKWAYVAAMIQQERAVASTQRARRRRLGLSAAIALGLGVAVLLPFLLG